MKPHERAGDLFMRADLLVEDERADKAVGLLEEALELVDPHHDFLLYVRYAHYLAETLARSLDDHDGALTWLTRVLSMADKPVFQAQIHTAADVFDVLETFITFADIAAMGDQIHGRHLLEVLDAADRVLERHGQERWRDATLHRRAKVVFELGRHDEGVELMRRAIRLGDEHGHTSPGCSADQKRATLGQMREETGRLHEEPVAPAEASREPPTST
jgi:tetratricopeptide (TPR) repeat protein